MLKTILVFASLALGVASAESYRVNLTQTAVVKGTELKAGEYRVNVDADSVTITKGKQQVVQSPVRVENGDRKYSSTVVRYSGQTLEEIRFGGTSTKIVFVQ